MDRSKNRNTIIKSQEYCKLKTSLAILYGFILMTFDEVYHDSLLLGFSLSEIYFTFNAIIIQIISKIYFRPTNRISTWHPYTFLLWTILSTEMRFVVISAALSEEKNLSKKLGAVYCSFSL